MRTFRLIEMTLLMVLCAVNFTACSDELGTQVILTHIHIKKLQ